VTGPAVDATVEEVLRGLVRRGLPEVEVLTKRGRSRRLALDLGDETSAFTQERAWAVRASSRRDSFFAAGAGNLPPGDAWPEPSGRPFRLPEPEAAPSWSQPSDFEAPLIGESEGLRLLAGLARELAAELPGARLLQAVLEDGSSEGELASCTWKRRVPAAARAGPAPAPPSTWLPVKRAAFIPRPSPAASPIACRSRPPGSCLAKARQREEAAPAPLRADCYWRRPSPWRC
jgi:hypothetical protein